MQNNCLFKIVLRCPNRFPVTIKVRIPMSSVVDDDKTIMRPKRVQKFPNGLIESILRPTTRDQELPHIEAEFLIEQSWELLHLLNAV